MSRLLAGLMFRVMAPDPAGGAGGGGGSGAAGDPAATGGTGAGAHNPLLDGDINDVPEAWREHARALRRENAAYRERLKNVDEAAAQAKIDTAIKKGVEDAQTAAKATIDAERAKDKADGEQRLIKSELKAACLKEGLVDTDALKLVDMTKLKLNVDGEVEGLKELVADLVKTKSYLFQAPNSNSKFNPPSDKKPDPVDAKALAKADPVAYEAAKAAAIRASRN